MHIIIYNVLHVYNFYTQSVYFRILLKRGKCLTPKSKGGGQKPPSPPPSWKTHTLSCIHAPYNTGLPTCNIIYKDKRDTSYCTQSRYTHTCIGTLQYTATETSPSQYQQRIWQRLLTCSRVIIVHPSIDTYLWGLVLCLSDAAPGDSSWNWTHLFCSPTQPRSCGAEWGGEGVCVLEYS